MTQITNPKQIRSIDRMKKRGFVVDYTWMRDFNPVVHMARVLNGLKRYAQVTADGMVNGMPEGVFV